MWEAEGLLSNAEIRSDDQLHLETGNFSCDCFPLQHMHPCLYDWGGFSIPLPQIFSMITHVKPQGSILCVPAKSFLSRSTLTSSSWDIVFHRWGAGHMVFELLELLGQFLIAKAQAHREEERLSSYCRGRLTTFTWGEKPCPFSNCFIKTTFPRTKSQLLVFTAC